MIAWIKDKLNIRPRLDWPDGEKALTLTREAQQMVRAMVPPFMFANLQDDQPRRYGDYLRQYTTWVYVCASRNASNVASVPLRLYAARRGTGRKGVPHRAVTTKQINYLQSKSHLGPLVNAADEIEEILEHPWLSLIREVNPFYNGFELIELLALNLELTGNAYWLMVTESGGVPIELWPLPAHLMSIKRSIPNGIEFYRFGSQQPYQNYDPEQIAHFRYPNPLDPFYGMGPLEASQLPVTLNNKFDQYENAVLDNGAVIPFFFGTDTNLNLEAQKRVRAEIDQMHRGFKKAGKYGFLWGGLKPFTVGSKPKDVNYEKGQDQTLEKIAAAFGVPMSMVITRDVNRANADAGREQYLRDTIVPKLKRIEQSINQDVMPRYDEQLFVAFDNPVPDDKEFMMQEADMRLKNYSITINEYRAAKGEDEVDWGDEPLVQGQLQTMTDALAEPEPQPMPNMGDLPDVPEPEEEESAREAAEYLVFGRKTQSPQASRGMEQRVRQWLNTIAIAASSNVGSIDIYGPNDVELLVPWPEVEEQGRDLLKDDLTATLNAGAQTGVQRLNRLGVSATWNIRNPAAIQWAADTVGKRITLITTETRDAIRGIISEGLRQGSTITEMRNQIRKSVGLNARQAGALQNFRNKLASQNLESITIEAAISEYRQKLLKQRGEMIARTETAFSWAEGNLQSYREAGIEKKEFSAANDACPICTPFDGKEYPIGSDEPQIPLHPSCRCDWLPVVQ